MSRARSDARWLSVTSSIMSIKRVAPVGVSRRGREVTRAQTMRPLGVSYRRSVENPAGSSRARSVVHEAVRRLRVVGVHEGVEPLANELGLGPVEHPAQGFVDRAPPEIVVGEGHPDRAVLEHAPEPFDALPERCIGLPSAPTRRARWRRCPPPSRQGR